MTVRFDNRVAIVTGAGGGLGAGYARALAARGAKVVVNDIAPGSAQRVADEIVAAGGAAIGVEANVADWDQVRAMVDRALSEWGRVDILVNNAGALRDKTFAKMELSDFRLVMEVCLMGSVHCTKAVWEAMRTQKYGRVVMISSSAGIYGNFGQANYSSAKMALIGLMSTLHLEGFKYGIHVNAMTPTAATETMARLTMGQVPDSHLAMLAPEFITPGLLHLVSEDGPSNVILSSGAGHFSRVVIGESEGVWLPEEKRTPEALADAFADVAAPKNPKWLGDAYDQVNNHLQTAADAQGVELEKMSGH